MTALTPERRAELRGRMSRIDPLGVVVDGDLVRAGELLALLDAADEADRLHEEQFGLKIKLDAKERTLSEEHIARQEAQRKVRVITARLSDMATDAATNSARVTELEKALERYGSHDYDCEADTNPPDGEGFLTNGFREPCTCGYTDALKRCGGHE